MLVDSRRMVQPEETPQNAEMVVSGADKINTTVENTSIWTSQRALGEE